MTIAAEGIRIFCVAVRAELDAWVFLTKLSISSSDVDMRASNVSRNVMVSFLARVIVRPQRLVRNAVNSTGLFICDSDHQENKIIRISSSISRC